jgi:hypothetical protein
VLARLGLFKKSSRSTATRAREIGVSEYFANWLYDPVKNGGGAIMDFGCYGAE